jgi:hypothetical protein
MTQLTDLLTSSAGNPFAVECSERITRGDALRHGGDCLMPLARAIDIYSARARINAERGGKVEGYEHLLPALAAAPVPAVRLHSLEFLSHWFVLFTDESSTYLFGILKSSKQKAAWYDPASVYDVSRESSEGEI